MALPWKVGSLLPNEPRCRELDDLRLILDDRQRHLSQHVFNDNTQALQHAAEKLNALNDQIKGTIRSVKNLVDLVDNVKRFPTAVDDLIGVAAPFV